MKIRSLTILVAVFMVTLVASPALAYYHPGMGRYMQRDPIGTSSHVVRSTPSSPLVMPISSGQTIIFGGAEGASTFIKRDGPSTSLYHEAVAVAIERLEATVGPELAGNSHLWQYADGMNLYQYARSNPVNATDPAGLISIGIGRTPFGPGGVTFTNCNPGQLDSLAVIPENQPPYWIHPPVNNHRYDVDGWRGRGWPANDWYKVPDHCDVTVECIPNPGPGGGTAFSITSRCNLCASIFFGRDGITSGGHASMRPGRKPF